MESLPWWLPALIYSFAGASSALLNEYFKLDGLKLTFWRGLIPTLALTPVIFTITPPSSPIFYLATAISSTLAVYIDTRVFNTAAQFGAGVMSRLKPVSIWLIFIFWLSINPSQIIELITDWHKSIVILIALSIMVVAAMSLKSCRISRAAFIYLLPALLLGVLINISNKVAMSHSPFFWRNIILCLVSKPIYYYCQF